jgi:hypothetical protein
MGRRDRDGGDFESVAPSDIAEYQVIRFGINQAIQDVAVEVEFPLVDLGARVKTILDNGY